MGSKSGPAPNWLNLGNLAVAVVYVAAAGYHAFRTLEITGFQRVGEAEVASIGRSTRTLQKLARITEVERHSQSQGDLWQGDPPTPAKDIRCNQRHC